MEEKCRVVKSSVARLERENARLRRENERLGAILEYVAMMADVELPEEDEESGESGEEDE